MGHDRGRVVLLGDGSVAEHVVEVLVRVDDREHRAAVEPAQVLEHPAGVALGRVGVDEQQSALPGDHADVDVEEGEARHPAPVADLGEPGVARQVEGKAGAVGAHAPQPRSADSARRVPG